MFRMVKLASQHDCMDQAFQSGNTVLHLAAGFPVLIPFIDQLQCGQGKLGLMGPFPYIFDQILLFPQKPPHFSALFLFFLLDICGASLSEQFFLVRRCQRNLSFQVVPCSFPAEKIPDNPCQSGCQKEQIQIQKILKIEMRSA